MQASPNRPLSPAAASAVAAPTRDGEPLLARVIRELSLLDAFVLAYHTILVSAAFFGQGPARATCLFQTSSLWLIFAVSLVLVRGGLFRHATFAPLLHRIAMYGTFQASYFFLRDLLPLASPHSLDTQLHAIDLAIFGVEPTIWVDRFITSGTTEWFSFFYYSYFFLLAIHVMPFIFAGKNRGLFPEFVMAIVGVYGVSQLVYFLVPGYGPYRALAGQFPHETLPRGFFQDLVQGAVSLGGAQKDIFPSLHTGGPFTIALFSFLHRDQKPFKYTWPIMMFFSLQIIGATIFLRWHWAIDVLAGLALSITVTLLAGRVSRWEQRRRAERGLMPVWLDVALPSPSRSEDTAAAE